MQTTPIYLLQMCWRAHLGWWEQKGTTKEILACTPDGRLRPAKRKWVLNLQSLLSPLKFILPTLIYPKGRVSLLLKRFPFSKLLKCNRCSVEERISWLWLELLPSQLPASPASRPSSPGVPAPGEASWLILLLPLSCAGFPSLPYNKSYDPRLTHEIQEVFWGLSGKGFPLLLKRKATWGKSPWSSLYFSP